MASPSVRSRLRSVAFDRLGSAAVILDATGTIVDTNDAWRLFADLNGGTGSTTGVGVNYLEVCERSGAAGDPVGAAVAHGLRQVLAGEQGHFDLEYHCGSLLREQWFLLRASAAIADGAIAVVAVHEDVTAAKRLRTLLDERAEVDEVSGTDEDGPTGSADHTSAPRGHASPGRAVHDPDASILAAKHHRAVLEALGEGVLVQDTLGRPLYANNRARDLLRDAPGAGRPSTEGSAVVDPSGTPLRPSRQPGRRALRERRPIENEVLGLRNEAGEIRWLEISSRPMTAPGASDPYAVVSALRDVTARRDADSLLDLKARLLDSVGQAVVAWDTAGVITYLNARAEEIYGWSRERAIGRRLSAVIDLDTDTNVHSMREVGLALASGVPWEGELRVRRADGSTVPIWSSNTPIVEDDVVTGHIGVSKDITEQKVAEAQLDHLLRHDLLTDLATRRTLDELVAERLLELDGTHVVSVLLIDIGSLDLLNDAFSLTVGDAAIVRCAGLLQGALHDGDDLARVSDHVFAVCCTHGRHTSEMDAYGRELRDAVGSSFIADGVAVNLQVSASVATTGSAGCGADELIRRAHTALVRARRDRDTRVYDDSMGAEIVRQVYVGELVARTLASGEVRLGYQPIVRLGDQAIVGAEALLRVLDDGELVSPVEIVEAAERSGQIPELGELILRTACIEAARWPTAASGRPMTISINLSARQLDDPRLAERVESALEVSGLPPTSLCLEITEGALMADPARAAAQLGALRARGIRFAADDFGTGYSSLAYLKALPLDALKIDQSFVAGLPGSLEDVAITQAVLAMSDALGLSVTAEGVETEEQLGALLELGTGFGQGFLWGRAVSGEAFAARVAAETDAPAPQAATVAAPWRIQRPAALGASEERIDSILGILAHEIRTPLSVVMGYASILRETPDPAEADAASAIVRAADRIARILTNMVDLNAGTDGSSLGELSVVDAVDAVRLAVGDQLSLVTVSVRLPDRDVEPVLIRIDAVQFAQVVSNLLSNASKFSPPGSPIEVAVEEHGGWVDISVTDRGPGVAVEDLGLIFRKYGRADLMGTGTGLGLYLARQIARSHGGDVLYRRAPSGGSTFVLRLPRERPAAADPT